MENRSTGASRYKSNCRKFQMSQFKIIFYLVLFLLTFLRCAYRDNQFDPQSPLYRPNPPQLILDIDFDTAKIISQIIDTDTIHAQTPFELTIYASAKGGYNFETELNIFFEHFIDGKKKTIVIIEDSLKITLSDSGTHLFRFRASENNGNPETIEEKVIFLTHKSAPEILYFKSNRTTLYTKENNQVIFTTAFTDSNNLLEKIVYQTSPFKNISKVLYQRSDTMYDTFPHTFFSDDTGIQLVTFKLVDIFNRVDSMNIELQFEEKIETPKIPPVINYISFYPFKMINVMDNVDFTVSFTPTTTLNYKIFWSYGDSETKTWTENYSHRFSTPGFYNVAVKVVDDSGSYAIDSIFIRVFPTSNKAPTINSLKIQPKTGDAPLLVKFTVSATDSDGLIMWYKWHFGTGYETFGDTEIQFTYWYPGKYPVTVIAFDDSWGTDTLIDTITVTGYPPMKPFLTAYPVPAYINTNIFFKLENIPPSFEKAVYIWEFPGDTIMGFEPSFSHSFTEQGDFTLQLKVITDATYYFTVPFKVVSDNWF